MKTLTVLVLISLSILIIGFSSFNNNVFATNQTLNINTILEYCFNPADKVTASEDVIHDLTDAGLILNSYEGLTCKTFSHLQGNDELTARAKEGFGDFLDAYEKMDK